VLSFRVRRGKRTPAFGGTLAHIKRRSFGRAGLAAAAVMAAGPAHADSRPTLSLPLACEPHQTCFIQSYVDIDPGADLLDYACGQATNAQHSGVDFRLLSSAAAKADVAVLAAADGMVKGVRDGVFDVFAKDLPDKDVIKGRECGNGVVIDHGGGWETQYCHLKQGSVRVAKDAAIKRGDRLGSVGYSGLADFAHLHLTVRRDDKVVDPFLPDAGAAACQRDARGPGLWEPSVAAAFPYRSGEIIASGFAGSPPDLHGLERDHTAVTPVSMASDALLVFGRFVNLIKDDRVRLIATGPGGGLIEQVSPPLDRNKATYLFYAGKKRSSAPWPPGRYEGRIELVRDGGVIATRVFTLDLR
jgi:murein DD-endopeptidase MepM/ murein hydrolase activator NlpD